MDKAQKPSDSEGRETLALSKTKPPRRKAVKFGLEELPAFISQLGLF
jgi:hypothetical protein